MLAQDLYNYAEKHYNDSFGWSVIVECWELEQIADHLEERHAGNLNEAIDAFSDLVDIWEDRFMDGINSAF